MGKNHFAVLEAAGLKPEDIVAGWVYLRDMQDYQGMNTIYKHVLLSRSRRPNLLDAEFQLREKWHPRPRIIHRGADAIGPGRSQRSNQASISARICGV